LLTYFIFAAFIGITSIVMYSLFWFVYILHLYLTLLYPLKLYRINRILKSRVTHVVEVLFVIIVVTAPNIYLLASSQYRIINFPPLFCAAGVDVNFYGIIFPTVVINCASFIMLLLVLQKIHRVSLLYLQIYTKFRGAFFKGGFQVRLWMFY